MVQVLQRCTWLSEGITWGASLGAGRNRVQKKGKEMFALKLFAGLEKTLTMCGSRYTRSKKLGKSLETSSCEEGSTMLARREI